MPTMPLQRRAALSSSWRFLRQVSSETQPPQLAWVPPSAEDDQRRSREERSKLTTSLDMRPPMWTGPTGPTGRSMGRLGRLPRITREAEELEQLRHRDDTVQELRRHVQVAIPGCDLVPFGSAATGLWLPDRDVDLSLQVPGLQGRIETKKALH
eukprot:s4635_g6.t1